MPARGAGAYALDERWLGLLHPALLECGDVQSTADSFEQLISAQQKVWIRRLAERLVADHERFVDEYAVRSQDVEQKIEARPIKVVRYDDTIETRARIRPLAALEIRDAGSDARQAREEAERLPAGSKREALLQKAREDRAAADMTAWLSPASAAKNSRRVRGARLLD